MNPCAEENENGIITDELDKKWDGTTNDEWRNFTLDQDHLQMMQ